MDEALAAFPLSFSDTKKTELLNAAYTLTIFLVPVSPRTCHIPTLSISVLTNDWKGVHDAILT